MNTSESAVETRNHELPVRAASGWLSLLVIVALYVATLGAFVAGVVAAMAYQPSGGWLLGASGVLLILSIVGSCGFFTLQPNEAAVLILFGAYQGTVRNNGFFWTNPFNKRTKISLRARTLNGDRLKVNDKRGNPVEIAAVVVWRVQDTAQAIFDVDDFEKYVQTQSESALRHLASRYSYDHGEENEITLRSNVGDVSLALKDELQE